MADITGGVKITGFISPTDSLDTYAVIDPLYGIDGLRSVSGSTEKNAIPYARRREGMVVYQQSNGIYYQLLGSPWTGSESDWVEFAPGTDTYVTGFTFNNANYQLTLRQNISGVYSSFTQDLSILSGDMTITGGTYNPSTGVATFTNNSGGTFNVTGFLTGYTDTYVTGGTYNPSTGILILTKNNGSALPNISGFYTAFTGGTVSGATRFTGGLTGNTISATTYQNIPYWTAGTGSNSVLQRNTNNLASGISSIAMGVATTASNTAAHSEGNQTTASGQASHAEGYTTIASGLYSHAEGNATTASNQAAHSEGSSTTANGVGSHAEGGGTIANGLFAHAEGNSTTAYGNYSHTEGDSTITNGNSGHAEGKSTTAYADYCHAEGLSTFAGGTSSHAEGTLTYANGDSSHAEGSGSTAGNNYSHAEGFGTNAGGEASHAEGYETIASGSYSHSEGYQTTASGYYSHAEGASTTASEDFSHSEGFDTNAIGVASHAQNGLTNAIGGYTHAEGLSTTAIGVSSHAEGSGTTSYGLVSHAEGKGTNAGWSGLYITSVAGNDLIISDDVDYSSYFTEGYVIVRTVGNEVYFLTYNKLSFSSPDFTITLDSTPPVDSYYVGADKNVNSGYNFGNYTHAGGYKALAFGDYSFIHGNNSIVVGENSIVLGANITGTTNNTTYVDNLNIKTIGAGTSVNNLGVDADGNVVVGTSGGGGGTFTGGTVTGPTTFTNGLTSNTLTVNGVAITGDTYVTGVTFNNSTYDLSIFRNHGSTLTTNLSILASDMTITGGTYNPVNGSVLFTNNTGGTFTVTGFVTGFTDTRVTGGTYNPSTAIATFTNNSGGTFGVSGFSTPNGPTNSVQFNAGNGVFSGSSAFTFSSLSNYNNVAIYSPKNVVGNPPGYSSSLSLIDNTGNVSGSSFFSLVSGLGTNNISAFIQAVPKNYTFNTASANGIFIGARNLSSGSGAISFINYLQSATLTSNFKWALTDTPYYASSQDIMVLSGGTSGNLWVKGNITTSGTVSSNSVKLGYVAKTGNYTITNNDYTVDCTSGSFTVTLPTAVGIAGQVFVIKNTGGGTITMATTSSQTIDNGLASLFNLTSTTPLRVQSTGANWITI